MEQNEVADEVLSDRLESRKDKAAKNIRLGSLSRRGVLQTGKDRSRGQE